MFLTADRSVFRAFDVSSLAIFIDAGLYDVTGWDSGTITIDASAGTAGFTDHQGVTALYLDNDGVVLASQFLGAARAGDTVPLVVRFRHLGPWVVYRFASWPTANNGTAAKASLAHTNRPMPVDGPYTPTSGGASIGSGAPVLGVGAANTAPLIAYAGPAVLNLWGQGGAPCSARVTSVATGRLIAFASSPGAPAGNLGIGAGDTVPIWLPPEPCQVTATNGATAQTVTWSVVASGVGP